jgi:hypothetical protein
LIIGIDAHPLDFDRSVARRPKAADRDDLPAYRSDEELTLAQVRLGDSSEIRSSSGTNGIDAARNARS